jgi:hypothetical protein
VLGLDDLRRDGEAPVDFVDILFGLWRPCGCDVRLQDYVGGVCSEYFPLPHWGQEQGGSQCPRESK